MTRVFNNLIDEYLLGEHIALTKELRDRPLYTSVVGRIELAEYRKSSLPVDEQTVILIEFGLTPY